MLISEIFNSKQEVDVVKDTPYNYTARMELDGVKYEVELNQEGDNVPWTLEFTADGSLKKNDKGNEFKVFAFVMDALNYVIKYHDPYRIEFSGSHEEGRADLYLRIAKRVRGYKVFHSNLKGDYGHAHFTLKRNYDV